jgi:hypothetical protein
MRWRPTVLAGVLWGLTVLCLLIGGWLLHLLDEAGRADLAGFDPATIAIAVVHVGLATVGALVASRRPRHPVGWLLLVFGVVGNASIVVGGYADYGLGARPGSLPGAWLAARYFPLMAVAGFAGLAFLLALTPGGSLPPSARWRWWAVVTAATPVALLPVATFAPAPAGQPYHSAVSPFDFAGFSSALVAAYRISFAVIIGSIMVAAGSLMLRFRRASGTERLQLRWVAMAAVLVGLIFVGTAVTMAIGAPFVDPGLAGTAGLAVLMSGIGAAVLRYRLYDLDRIIRRTLSYALLTVLLAGGYTVLVLGLGQVLDRSSSLVVAAATLAVAAAFQPVRRRVQDLVDRRFNRRRYDAAQTIGAFAARLREQVDLDSLTAELLAVSEQTMQPTHASLWLRPRDAPRPKLPTT